MIAKRNDVLLRHASQNDLVSLDEITIICYEPIQRSYTEIVGEAFSDTMINGDWKARKINQVRNLFDKHPKNVWVLEKSDNIIGYISFFINLDKKLGIIDNNGVLPDYRGKSLGSFMYRQVLKHFKNQGLHFAMVETDLDEPHIPARRAYEAVGFNRQHRIVNYIQDLTK